MLLELADKIREILFNRLPADLTTLGNLKVSIQENVATSGGGLTDTQLRASAVPVSVSGVATAGNQATEIASLANLDVALSTRLKPADTLTAVTSITNPVTVTGTITATVTQGNNSTPIDGVNVLYTNDQLARRLQEQLTLEAYEQSIRSLILADPVTSHRMGFEVR